MPVATEKLHPHAEGLDARPLEQATAILIRGQAAAAGVVEAAAPQIALGARTMAATLSQGGTLYYVAAGSSGLMAAADAQELGGTFSIPSNQLRVLMAGGLPTGVEMPGDTEDATEGIQEGLSGIRPIDTLIALSASGTTPYTLRAVEIAKPTGATVIGIANNAGSPLLVAADIAIALLTPPEVLSGSTRLGAGTAQKIALNTLSTAMAIELGHIHDGMMVNLYADNIKLRDRAARIVSQIAGVSIDDAKAALAAANGGIKIATLVAAKNITFQEAEARLSEANGRLRTALGPTNSPTSNKEIQHD